MNSFNVIKTTYNYMRFLKVSPYFVGFVILIQIAMFLTEAASLGMFLPIADTLMSSGGGQESLGNSDMLARIYAGMDFFGIERDLTSILVFSFVLFMLRQVFAFFGGIVPSIYREHLVTEARRDGFKRYIEATTEYHDGADIGRIINDLDKELERSANVLSTALQIIHQCLLTVGYLVILTLISHHLVMFIILILGLTFVLVNMVSGLIERTAQKLTKANQKAIGFMIERLRNVSLTKLSGSEQSDQSAMHDLTGDQFRLFYFLTIVGMSVQALLGPIFIGMVFLSLYIGHFHLAMAGSTVSLFVGILIRLTPVFKGIIASKQEIHGQYGSIGTVQSLFADMLHMKETGNGINNMDPINDRIVFENVSYEYMKPLESGSKRVKALKNVSFQVLAGAITAIIGPSGSGKSTIVDMLPLLREPQSGKILVDGTSLRQFTLNSVRRRFSYAPQFPIMFDISIMDHIRMGRPEALDNEIIDAAKLSDAHNFITSLAQGYDTKLGDRGDKVSGGQARRIDLARALLKDADVLILDEPTSGLDFDSEKKVVQALIKIQQKLNTTIVIISHQIQSLRFVDNFIVLEDGAVSATGNFAEVKDKSVWLAAALKKPKPSHMDQN